MTVIYAAEKFKKIRGQNPVVEKVDGFNHKELSKEGKKDVNGFRDSLMMSAPDPFDLIDIVF